MNVRTGTHLLLIACLHAFGCTPLVTEPRPDIPAVPDESTVLLELGGESESTSTMGLELSALVGDASTIGKLTNTTILGTNTELRENLRLIKAISETPVESYDNGVWNWSFEQDDLSYDFSITTEPGEDTYGYLLLASKDSAPFRETFSGTMTFFQSRLGAQQGFGTLKFVFDDSNPRSTRGAANVSFRRRGGVRQVNVGLTNFRIKPATEEPRNAIYSYLHFPDRRGRFMYQTKTDAFGEAESTIGVDVAFTAFGSGRGIALLPPKENVENERVMIEECWDPMLSVTFQTSTPEIPRFVDGERKSCPESLANIELRPPTEVISDPNDVRTPLPEKHPLEED